MQSPPAFAFPPLLFPLPVPDAAFFGAVPFPVPVPIEVFDSSIFRPLQPLPKYMSPNCAYYYLNYMSTLDMTPVRFLKGIEMLTVTMRIVTKNGIYFEMTKDSLNRMNFESIVNSDDTGDAVDSLEIFYRVSSSVAQPKVIEDIIASELIRGPYKIVSERKHKNVNIVELKAVL